MVGSTPYRVKSEIHHWRPSMLIWIMELIGLRAKLR